jgi:hypothetical protein
MPLAELGGISRTNATWVAAVGLETGTGWLRLRFPPSQSSGGSIGGQQNCLLSEFPFL